MVPGARVRVDAWLSGLVALVILLLVLTPLAYRAAPVTKPAAFAFAAIMLLNGIGHLAGSIYFSRWMPGVTTAPLLLGASMWLFREAARSRSGIR